MKLKIITLNIWRYYEWEKRKKKLIRFLKRKKADIILLQEAASSEKSKWKNQIEEINAELQYPSFAYSNMAKMTKWHEQPIDYEMHYGLGIISKFRIKKQEFVKLKPVVKNKDFGFLHAVIETERGDIHIINVHFENTDEGSKEQLKEALKWCEKKKISPIIAGDFNMKETCTLKEIAGKDFDISYFIRPYFSFMPTNFSNNKKPITLDYIIAKKNRFMIKKIKCIKNTPSDHNPLLAIIELK